MSEELTIQQGSQVKLHYSITLEDGTVADSSFEEEPLEITVGEGEIHQSLEFALYGLRRGDDQTIQIDPAHGFGMHDPDNIYDLSRDGFPDDMDVSIGQIISLTAPNGEDLPGSIVDVSEDTVKVDLNHPFAGHSLTFRSLILDVVND
jgi:FKBP-type peptidyl-prolyl cis-trans isomerase SlpA